MTTPEITAFINEYAPAFSKKVGHRPTVVFIHSSEVPRSCPSSINGCKVIEDCDERLTTIDRPLKLGYIVND
jgi:hypothetical protein